MQSPVAVLGGTFNPPHRGHIDGALSALDTLGVSKLGLMPCKLPPHKTTAGISEQHRVAMVELLCDKHPRLYAELIELGLPAPSYSVKTLKALRQRYPGAPLLFVIGEDSLHSLDSWYEWHRLLHYCHLIVMRREDPQANMSAELQKWLEEHRNHDPQTIKNSRSGYIYIAHTAYHAASSTLIRSEAAQSRAMTSDVAQWLPPEIISYINQHNLYSNTK